MVLIVSPMNFSYKRVASDLSRFTGYEHRILDLSKSRVGIEGYYDTIVYVGGINGRTNLSVAYHLSKHCKNLVLWVDDAFMPKEEKPVDNIFSNYVLVPISEWNKEVYERYVKNVIEVVPRGTTFRTRWNTIKNYAIVSATGGYHKAFDDIVLAYGIYSSIHGNLSLVIVGGGGASVKNANNSDGLIVSILAKDDDEYARLLGESKFLINLGLESFSLPSIDAWGMGVPSLYTTLPDISNHSRGISIEPVDIDCITSGDLIACRPVYDEYDIVRKMEKILEFDRSSIEPLPEMYYSENVARKISDIISQL